MLHKIKEVNGTQMERGFSLVEMLIYVFLLVGMLLLILNITLFLVRSGKAIHSLRSIESSAVASAERITRELRGAEDINTTSSLFDTNPGKLVLDTVDESSNPHTLEFSLVSGRLVVFEDSVEVGALTQEDATVTDLVFRRFAGPNSEGAKVEMTIESGTSTAYRTNNFYFSAVTR